MTIVESILIAILQAGLLLLTAPLYSGFSRVLRAKIHNRVGPPLAQNYRDLSKLFRRQEVVPRQAGWVFRAAPYITLAAMLSAAVLIPVLTRSSPLGAAADLILVVYLFALPRFFFAAAGLDSGSTFAGIGGRRELLLAVLVEPVLLLVVLVMALLAGSTNLGAISSGVAGGSIPISMAFLLSLAAFAFASFVEMGKLPYDVGEAEQELQEGPLSEYSGRSLALMKWGIYLKQLVLAALFVALFIPIGAAGEITLPGLILAVIAFLLKIALFYFIAALVENVMARARFMNAPAGVWLAFGAAVMSFVFFLASV